MPNNAEPGHGLFGSTEFGGVATNALTFVVTSSSIITNSKMASKLLSLVSATSLARKVMLGKIAAVSSATVPTVIRSWHKKYALTVISSATVLRTVLLPRLIGQMTAISIQLGQLRAVTITIGCNTFIVLSRATEISRLFTTALFYPVIRSASITRAFTLTSVPMVQRMIGKTLNVVANSIFNFGYNLLRLILPTPISRRWVVRREQRSYIDRGV